MASPAKVPTVTETAAAKATSAVRVLGGCGLASAAFSMLAGFCNRPILLGLAGALMIAGNVYAILRGGGS